MMGPTRQRAFSPTLAAVLAAIAVLLVLPFALAARAEAFIYWVNQNKNKIARANLDGTGVLPKYIVGASRPEDVAVNDKYIYWTNVDTETIGRATLDGTRVNQELILARPVYPGTLEVAVDSAHVYWTTGSAIGRANLDGTHAEHDFITGTGAFAPYDVAVDGSYLYWTSGTIGRANLDGTGIDYDFIPPAGRELAVDGSYIYWTGGPISRASVDGTRIDQDFIRAGVPTGWP